MICALQIKNVCWTTGYTPCECADHSRRCYAQKALRKKLPGGLYSCELQSKALGALRLANQRFALTEQPATSTLSSELVDVDVLDYHGLRPWCPEAKREITARAISLFAGGPSRTRTLDRPVILLAVQVRFAHSVLCTPLGYAKPPRSNLHAAHLCEHRLARV